MQGWFERSIDSLEEVFAFTGRFFAREGIDRQHGFTVELAVEELFTNMVKYNPAGGGRIELRIERTRDAVRVVLHDPRSAPFDVTEPRPVDPDAPIGDRESGGLGLYLVQQLADSLDYRHQDGASIITFTRKLGRAHVRN